MMKTLTARAREYGVRMEAGPATRAADDDGWEHDRYRVRLRLADRTMRLTYRKGAGHMGSPPTLEEVLDCIVSDSATLDGCESFEEWAGELGYDTDSRKAEATYRQVVKQADAFRALLEDPDVYDAFLYETERL